jgi:serine/threonine-protein kinase
MSEQPPLDRTVDLPPTEAALDAGLAAAFGPDSGPPLPASASVLRALCAGWPEVPRVQLRDPDSGASSPIVRPCSEQMPPPAAAGRYQLLGEIARGGMGAVLKGRDVDLGRDIAVKVLLETHQGKTELLQRFVEEAQISGQLQHPGIVPVYELGQFADRRPYFTMKLVKGKTLAKLLEERQNPRQNQPQLLKVFEQVCQTLAYAHARGVIHRDLKPSNVMVGAFGEVQVMDWGLAKVLPEGGVADENRTQLRPEVSVIRTRRSEGSDAPGSGSSQTQAGSVLGTPAYMAPEQARGEVELVDERADVFGVGAILCEILTGRPPFTGKPAEAQRKAQTGRLEEAYRRLDGCGADVELVELAKHCLADEPFDRPRHAGAVAAAVDAYQQSVADRLRQAELQRAAAEARAAEEKNTRQMAEAKAAAERTRRRATVALAAAVLALVVLGGGAAAWWWRTRTAMVRDVETSLAEASSHGEAGHWPEARAALERAEGRLGGLGPQDLLARVKQARTDANLVAELEDIRLGQAENTEGKFDVFRADAQYAVAFAGYGIDVTELEASEAAARVRGSAIREPLVAALDAWTALTSVSGRQTKLAAITTQADENPWRRAFRQATQDKDVNKLRALATQPEALAQPPAVLCLLGDGLVEVGLAEQAAVVLRQAQQRYPGDFWINYLLGQTLVWKVRPQQAEEAMGYFRAAVALRPRSAPAHTVLSAALVEKGDPEGAIAACRQALALDAKYAAAQVNLGLALAAKGNLGAAIAAYREAGALDPKSSTPHNCLGIALLHNGDTDGAIAAFKEALALTPKYAAAHNNLGNALKARGNLEGAIAEYRTAIALDTRNARPHLNLGNVLHQTGDAAGALAEYRDAVALDRKNTSAHARLREFLIRNGQLEEARAAWQAAVEQGPPKHDQWWGYADLCLFLGHADAYRSARQALLKRFGDTLDPVVADRAAKSCLLLAAAPDELCQAAALADRALAAGPQHGWYGYFQLVKGLAEFRQGRLDSAEEYLGEAIAPKGPIGIKVPGRLVLAMVHQRRGQPQKARRLLAAAVTDFDWSVSKADHPDAWIFHVLRREAEALILPNLPAFLRGEYQPQDNDERLALLGLCQFKGLRRAAARLYADALADDPKLAEDVEAGHRYNAACLAALAGSGQGAEAAKLDAQERARLCRQSLAWLRADLSAYGKRLEAGTPEGRRWVEQRLRFWQRDSDLAGVRDPAAVAKLPAEEQEQWRKLWAEVDVLWKNAQMKP